MKKFLQNRWVWFAARLLLGGLFLLAGIAKITDIPYFIEEVNGYGLLPAGLVPLIGWVIPFAELFIASALILGVFVRLMAVLIPPMAVAFGAAGIYAIVVGGGIRCGCFGSLIPLTHQQSLTIDIVMLFVSLVLVMQKGKEFLALGQVFDRIKPEWRTKRLLWFDFTEVMAVLLVAALVAAVAFGLKNMRAGDVTKAGNLNILSPLAEQATVPPPAGQSAPGFDLSLLSGKKVALKEFRGKAVLIVFWQSG